MLWWSGDSFAPSEAQPCIPHFYASIVPSAPLARCPFDAGRADRGFLDAAASAKVALCHCPLLALSLAKRQAAQAFLHRALGVLRPLDPLERLTLRWHVGLPFRELPKQLCHNSSCARCFPELRECPKRET